MSAQSAPRGGLSGIPGALPLVVGLIYLLLAAGAVFLTQQRQDQLLPLGLSPQFALTAQPDNLRQAELQTRLAGLADRLGVNLYLRAVDLDRPDTICFYAFVGQDEVFTRIFPGATYPSFSRDRPVELRLAEDLGTTGLTGLYYGDATVSQPAAVLAALQQAGFTVDEVVQGPPPTFLLLVTVEVSLGAALTVGLALSVMAGAAFGLAQAQAGAVRQAHGRSWARTALSDHGHLLAGGLGLVAVIGLALGTGLWGYNGFNQGGTALARWGALAGGGLLATQLGLTLMELGLGRLSVARRLRGTRPHALMSAVAVACLIAAWAAAFPCLSSALSTARQIQQDSQVDDAWMKARDLVSLSIAGTTAPDDWESIDQAVGQLSRRFSGQDVLVLSHVVRVISLDEAANFTEGVALVQVTDADYPQFPLGTFLEVNSAFLAINPLTDGAGRQLDLPDLGPNQAWLLIPPARQAEAAAYAAAARDTLLAYRQDSFSEIDPVTPFSITVVELAAGQSVLTLNPDLPRLADPVIVVLATELMPDAFLTAALTQGGALFRDVPDLRPAIDQVDLTPHLAAIESVADQGVAAAVEHREQLGLALAAITSLAIGLAVVANTLARSHCQAQAQRLFVQRVHGRSFLHQYGVALAQVTGLWLVCWLVEQAVGLVIGPGVWAALAAGCLFSLGFAASLARQGRRVAATGLRQV
ncbi:MAG: hypothetical protein LBK42_14580 [Propionibacteriaceae bacterium]|nr:hypothetical protein [Propionibacteriaceae bacterium]